ncbi:hypothetical protein TeGR_g12419, partial [Tetraparma gracilis]
AGSSSSKRLPLRSQRTPPSSPGMMTGAPPPGAPPPPSASNPRVLPPNLTVQQILDRCTAERGATMHVVTARVVVGGQFLKRESSGQARVKRARCYNLNWGDEHTWITGFKESPAKAEQQMQQMQQMQQQQMQQMQQMQQLQRRREGAAPPAKRPRPAGGSRLVPLPAFDSDDSDASPGASLFPPPS